MRSKKKSSAMLCAALGLALLLGACGQQPNTSGTQAGGSIPAASNPASIEGLETYTIRSKQTNAYFATASQLSLYDDFTAENAEERYEKTWKLVKDILEEIENEVSVSIPGSDIARFNALRYGESTPVSQHTANLFRIALDVYEESGGLYDPTVYNLVDLWGLAPRFNVNDYAPVEAYDRPRSGSGFAPPDETYIEAFLGQVNLGGIQILGDEETGYTLVKNIPPVEVGGAVYEAKLDLGGIAKGYAADLVEDMLREQGYEYGFFSCGGSSMSLMRSASASAQEEGNDLFNLGIRKPRPGSNEDSGFSRIKVKNVGLSTSGDYDHCYYYEDVLYCHLIDTRTGYPINMPVDGVQRGIASVTVLGQSAAHLDALTTAIAAMPLQDALDFINTNYSNVPVILVVYSSEADYYEILTNAGADIFAIGDESYRLASEVDAAGGILYTGSLLA